VLSSKNELFLLWKRPFLYLELEKAGDKNLKRGGSDTFPSADLETERKVTNT